MASVNWEGKSEMSTSLKMIGSGPSCLFITVLFVKEVPVYSREKGFPRFPFLSQVLHLESVFWYVMVNLTPLKSNLQVCDICVCICLHVLLDFLGFSVFLVF